MFGLAGGAFTLIANPGDPASPPIPLPPPLETIRLELIAPGGARVWVAGHLMRRHSPDRSEPPGRIEIVATALSFPDLEAIDCPERSGFAAGSAFDVEHRTRSR